MSLDVLLINPGDQRAVFQSLAEEMTAKEPPIWCRLIASYLERKKCSVEIMDAEVMVNLTAEQLARCAVADGARLIVVVVHGHQPSASTQKMPAATSLIKELVNYETPVLVVGGHPAALPKVTLIETEADFVCTGEGPVTVYELLQFVKSSANWRWACKVDVKGVAYWDHGEVVTNDPAPNVQNLTAEMSGGGWGKFSSITLSQYRSYAHHAWSNDFKRQPYASIYTSLGCPYHCGFCMIQTPFKAWESAEYKGANMYRMWSPEYVIREIDLLVGCYGVTNIRVDDEMFVLNERHVLAICDLITERFGDSLNLWCYGRVDQTKDKFLEKMRRAGFKWICLGIESLSEYVRDGVDKAGYGAEDIIKTVERIKQHDINIIANYMFGLPDDTAETMRQTLDLALELKTEYVNMYAAVAFPGSKLFTDYVAAGWKPPIDWLAWSFHSYEHEPLGTKTLSPAEVLRFRDTAFTTYFNNQSYKRYIYERFGIRALDEVEGMLKHILRRKLLGD